MGAESTAAIHRMLTDPEARPDTIAPDFTNLLIVIAQTGDEWSTTGDLVDIGNPGYQNMRNSSTGTDAARSQAGLAARGIIGAHNDIVDVHNGNLLLEHVCTHASPAHLDHHGLCNISTPIEA